MNQFLNVSVWAMNQYQELLGNYDTYVEYISRDLKTGKRIIVPKYLYSKFQSIYLRSKYIFTYTMSIGKYTAYKEELNNLLESVREDIEDIKRFESNPNDYGSFYVECKRDLVKKALSEIKNVFRGMESKVNQITVLSQSLQADESNIALKDELNQYIKIYTSRSLTLVNLLYSISIMFKFQKT